ncbi:MAG: hypothetical protein AB7P20_14705 [Rhizobiaceae bacterium]
MTTGSAIAQEVIKGVYLGSAELCVQARKDGLQSVVENNTMILTNRGFETIEFNCAFLQFVKNPRMPAGWVVTSMCEEPDNAYPEIFSLVERRVGELDVAALTEVNRSAEPQAEEPAEGGEDLTASGLTGTYFLCDGVNPP